MKGTKWLLTLVVTMVLASGWACQKNTATTTTEPAATEETTTAPADTLAAPAAPEAGTETTTEGNQ